EVWSVDLAYCEHWQPLLTEAEWRARYPLALRKLGEGEELNGGCSYVMKNRASGDLQTLVVVSGHPARRHDYDYYELPPLPPAESEPTPFEEGKAILRELVDSAVEAHGEQILEGVDPAVHRVLGETAPNSVGDRLTEAPEVGTPVVYFTDIDSVSLYKWKREDKVCDHLYRWHGPIPVEPKEPQETEKPEPPKWLGAVRRKQNGGDYF